MRELLRKYATDLEAQRSGLLYYRIAPPTSQHVTFDFHPEAHFASSMFINVQYSTL
jgi:hypothetical protein